jgi:hypothetical protein
MWLGRMTDDQQPRQSMMNRELSDRGLGIFALIGSGVLTYLCVIAPLLAASRHEHSISLSLKGAIVTPVIFTIGIINVIMGEKARQILGRRQMPSGLGWVIYIVAFGLGILLHQWVNIRLREYGYKRETLGILHFSYLVFLVLGASQL